MEADIQLALIEKARQVFESDTTFLSFPLTAIGFKPVELDFLDEDDNPSMDAMKRASFSRLVNQIPRGQLWDPGEESYLWDVYDDVLNRSLVATGTRTAGEEEQYQKAMTFLYEVTDDGLRVPSRVAAKYQEYYDAMIVLKEQFGAQKVDAELLEDADLKKKWREEGEPGWRTAIKNLEQRWRAEGFKDRVEQARLIENSLCGRSPVETWHEWGSQFDVDLDLKADLNGDNYAETNYLPVTALRDSSWSKFTINGDVAKKLIEDSPEELKKKLKGQANTVTALASMSFEYSTAKLQRYWFAPQLFNSHFFKYDELISDGETTVAGRCPAYVAAVVFARNVDFELKGPVTGVAPMAVNLHAIKTLAFTLPPKGAHKPPPSPPARQPSASATLSPRDHRTLVADHRTQVVDHRTQVTVRPATAAAAVARRKDFRKRTAKPPAAPAVTGTLPRARIAPQVHRMKLAMPQLQLRTVVPLGGAAKVAIASTHVAAHAGHAHSPPATQPEAADETVYILAFICKRVPKCPDPDPNLNWEF